MLIRVHEADLQGHPIANSGDVFGGVRAMDIVEGMQLNPFNASIEPVVYMRKTLATIGYGDVVLPDDAEEAAEVFLDVLIKAGFASRMDHDDDFGKEDKP